jgi:flagellar assembly protein FliH
MNSSSERLTRGRVLTGQQVVGTAVTAELGAVASRAARAIVVSPELVEYAKQEGYSAGFAEGQAAGYAEGIAQAQRHTELLAGLVQRLGQAADGLMSRETTARHQIEDEVVATAFQIAEVLVGHELATNEERGRDALARALALAPDRGLVVARLNPADLALIDVAAIDVGRTIELVPDPGVVPGDCVVDVGACRVDARISDALTRIREVLA